MDNGNKLCRIEIVFAVLSVLFYSPVFAQVDCKTFDINKAPGKWVWASVAPSYQEPIPSSQWKICEPIRKELQRIMPIAIDGLHVTNSIAYPKDKSFWYTNSPAAYECYLMLKKYECLKRDNILQPEGETGCWIYFSINKINGSTLSSVSTGGVLYHAYESSIKALNIDIETDAAGNKIIYTNARPGETIKSCYYFSERKGFPLRKITNKELFLSYKNHHEKRVEKEIVRFQKLVADDEKKYNGLSAAEKQKQNYWPDIIKKNKEALQGYLNEQIKIKEWYNSALLQSNINDTASVSSINESHFYPERLVSAPGQGYNAWVDNLDFFDKTKPKDEPQCITLYIRRQDGDLPKKNFMDLFHSQFNLDVISKMVKERSKKPNGINTLDGSSIDVKTESKANQNSISTYNYSFDKNISGQFPSGWYGMKNNMVKTFENKNWLAFTTDGYCYPQQFNKEIKDNFNLSFDISWNKDIAFNSGLFTLSISEIPYDNATQRYKMDDNQNQYWSLFDSYVGKFNRVMIWFDPYWNGGGTMEVYSYDKNESIGVRKRITLPDFYLTKNNHQIKIQRKGNGLVVFINNKKEAEMENVFIPSVKYNLYTFSRYKGNNSDNKNDVFYLNNITSNY